MVNSLEAAPWAFCQSQYVRKEPLSAINLGNDADITGAVYGQIDVAGDEPPLDKLFPDGGSNRSKSSHVKPSGRNRSSGLQSR